MRLYSLDAARMFERRGRRKRFALLEAWEFSMEGTYYRYVTD